MCVCVCGLVVYLVYVLFCLITDIKNKSFLVQKFYISCHRNVIIMIVALQTKILSHQVLKEYELLTKLTNVNILTPILITNMAGPTLQSKQSGIKDCKMIVGMRSFSFLKHPIYQHFIRISYKIITLITSCNK